MINRNQPRLNSNRPLGSSPLQRVEFNPTQKENHFSNNAQVLPKPLISPKHNQPQNVLTFDRPHKPKMNFNRPGHSPRSTVNTDRSSQPSVCCNHQNKKADCRIFTEDGFEYFCNRCAAQLVTQGYKAEQLQNVTEQGMKFSKKNSNALPHLPQFEQEPIYHEIIDIIKLCNTVVSEHTSNIQQFSNLEEQYHQQADLTSAFYDRLIDIIEEMKTDHLSDLLQEKDKYTQIADIENDNSRQNIIEINNIKNDIQGNMEEVLEGIQNSGDSSECKESLGHYRQKLTLYRHQAEEQLESISEVTRYSQLQIDTMLQNFQNFLAGMWEEAEDSSNHDIQQQTAPLKQMNSAMTVKNIHQILPRGVAYDVKPSKKAFRNLEAQEEEENLEERKSPNFKKI